MADKAIDKVIRAYQERNWTYCVRPLGDNPPTEQAIITPYVSDSEEAKFRALYDGFSGKFIFQDLELLSAQLEHPELEVYGNNPGIKDIYLLTEDWEGHQKDKLALAFFVKTAQDKKANNHSISVLWLIEV